MPQPMIVNPDQTQDEFLRDLNPKEGEALGPEASTEGGQPEGGESTTEMTPEEKSNRRERRLQTKLQAERESSIALAARLQGITEAQKLRGGEAEGEFLKTVEKIYGTNTPEAVEATELLKKSLLDVKKAAKEEALEALREEQAKEREAMKNEEKALDTMVEDIEDEYGVTIDPQTQKSFFQLLEKLSPKDSEGNVIAYADHHSVWEELQSRRTKPTNRAKDLASRSMVHTGSGVKTGVEADANERWLRENGII